MEPALDKISRNVSPDDGNHTSKASRSARKRTRDAVKAEDLNDTFDLGDDGRPKTRRVNPQRLALRLGPDLVAEMEALIVPGAKMPNFTVRKDFQERYNVDRRHIYDYFHSRGLRVSKEDKHTNLIRGRALKAAAAAAAATESAKAVAPVSSETSSVTDLSINPVQEAPTQVNPDPGLSLAIGIGRKDPKPTEGTSKKRKTDRVKVRRAFLATGTGDSSRDGTVSPIIEATTPHSDHESWQARDVVEQSHSDSSLSTTTQHTPGFEVAVLKDDPFHYLPYAPSVLGSINPLLITGHPGFIESEYSLFYTDSGLLDGDSLDKGARTDLYNLVQNSLYQPLGSTSCDMDTRDWSFSSSLLTGIDALGSHRLSKEPVSSISATDYSSQFSAGTSEHFDIRGWILEDTVREEPSRAQAPIGLGYHGPSPRQCCSGAYEGCRDSDQMNVRECATQHRSQSRTTPAVNRGSAPASYSST